MWLFFEYFSFVGVVAFPFKLESVDFSKILSKVKRKIKYLQSNMKQQTKLRTKRIYI